MKAYGRYTAALVVFVLGAAGATQGAKPTLGQDLASRLLAGDAVLAAQARNEVMEMLASDPPEGAHVVRTELVGPLLAAHKYDLVLDLTEQTILAVPDQTSTIEALQQSRVRALLSLKRTRDAVVEAKRLFNVATMNRTAEAINLMADAIQADGRNNGLVAAARFKLEQLQAERVGAADAITPAPSTLRSIDAHSTVYDEAARELDASDYLSVTGRANLLLLADRADDACTAFKHAYAVAPQKQLAEATENLARAMRAQDGGVGRANQWVLALRLAK